MDHGTTFKTVTTIYKNEYVRVFAKIGTWYVVQTNNDYVGVASSKYIRLVYPNTNTSGANTSTNTGGNTGTTNSNGLTAEEQEVFNLVNKQRTANRTKSFTSR